MAVARFERSENRAGWCIMCGSQISLRSIRVTLLMPSAVRAEAVPVEREAFQRCTYFCSPTFRLAAISSTMCAIA